jgi:cyclic-di-AMP phosphodiesterase PgpH
MATGGQKRSRSERVAALELPPGQWERAWINLRRRDVLGRAALALLTAVAICAVIRAWDPPLSWRQGMAPQRDITARVAFRREDKQGTERARENRRRDVPYFFAQDAKPLVQLRAALHNKLVELLGAKEYKTELWRPFQSESASSARSKDGAKQFAEFRKLLAGEGKNLEHLDRAVAEAMAPLEKHGLLAKLPSDDPELVNQKEISVYPMEKPREAELVNVSDVLIGDGAAIHQSLLNQIGSREVAQRIFAWLKPQLQPTLKADKDRTHDAREAAAAAQETLWTDYKKGDVVVNAGEVLDDQQMDLLRLEHAAYLAQRTAAKQVARATAILLVIFVLLALCGVYLRYRQPSPLASVSRLIAMLGLTIATVALARLASMDPWRAELVPLLLFGMTMAIVYRRELALLLSGVLAWVVTLAIGHNLPSFLLLFGTMTAACLTLGRVRSRSKLIYVGLFAGIVAAALDVAVHVIDNQVVGQALLTDAARCGAWALAAGFLMTGLLPFIERAFGVLTDLSLLELGDITHPLLQELVRRAPSTYAHSLTVGSIGESAADSIGARGLLVRVGAYFHDIGKMLKPGYFVENQGPEASRHDTLVPAMSTLVIIAHIKDGSDLARQHRLPQPIIDMIKQHHGTTLVEYFYDRAQRGSNPDNGEVDESNFRYPGPKPQTKEAAVLMLADTVESACRTLVDPTPARIEGLVRELAQRRLHGGQFDESGLTLRELRTIERSIVMSLSSIYHGRLKYPDQREREREREQRTA